MSVDWQLFRPLFLQPDDFFFQSDLAESPTIFSSLSIYSLMLKMIPKPFASILWFYTFI